MRKGVQYRIKLRGFIYENVSITDPQTTTLSLTQKRKSMDLFQFAHKTSVSAKSQFWDHFTHNYVNKVRHIIKTQNLNM